MELSEVNKIAQAYFVNKMDAEDAVQLACVYSLERKLPIEKCIDDAIKETAKEIRKQSRNETPMHETVDEVFDINWYIDKIIIKGDFVDKISAELVHKLMNELPKRWLTAIKLFYLEKKTQKEIAIEMGTSEKAIKNLLERSRKRLKKLFEKESNQDVTIDRKKKVGRPLKSKPKYTLIRDEDW
jgi:RNA polymerase sigma factor (sigma-70 family)